MVTHWRFDASSLPGQVGTDRPNGSRLSDGRSGHISYGPYFSADPGLYVAGFYLRRTGEPQNRTFQIDVLAGGEELAHRSVLHSDLFDDIPTLVYLNFELREPTQRIEVRLYVDENITLEIQSLLIFKTPSRSWGEA